MWYGEREPCRPSRHSELCIAMSTRVRAALALVSLFLLSAPPRGSAAEAATGGPATSEAKPYVLFMRTDLSVAKNKKLYPVKDVSGRDFIVSVNGTLVTVPTVGEQSSIEFKHALTLARNPASLTGLVTERSYTPWNDPRMQRQRDAVRAEAAMGDKASLAEGQMIVAMNKSYVAVNSDARAPDGTPIHGAADAAAAIDAQAAARAATAFQSMSQAETLRESNVTSGAFARLAAENDLRQDLFDAISIRFEISSPVYLERPYLVAIIRFHTRDDRPGVARNVVIAKALEAVGTRPTKIDVLQGGFPPGFEMEDAQLHLYNDGQEIPTDVAQKRVPLSRDEAFEYLKIEYVASHKNDTVIATPALGQPTKEQRLQITPNQWKAYYYAKVSRDGMPVGTYLDEACTQPVDGLIGELARNVRYYPAMEKGRPVEGTARLSLRELKL
ncbi:MAG TPA: hypothetical protein VHD61_11370 [Lacunisphaera sp.]|nr:hypothetical protein [Lacunisphaera sp.]